MEEEIPVIECQLQVQFLKITMMMMMMTVWSWEEEIPGTVFENNNDDVDDNFVLGMRRYLSLSTSCRWSF